MDRSERSVTKADAFKSLEVDGNVFAKPPLVKGRERAEFARLY